MSRLIPAAERLTRARNLIQQARDLPVPEEIGSAYFSYVAQIKDFMRQARELIKFIAYTSGIPVETKEEVKVVSAEIDQTEKEILHKN